MNNNGTQQNGAPDDEEEIIDNEETGGDENQDEENPELGDDEDSADDAEGAGDDEDSEEQDSGKTSSSDARVQAALDRAEAAERRAIEAEARSRERERVDNAKLSEQERKEKLEKMTPEERLTFMANEAMNRVDFMNKQAEFRNADFADKSDFQNRFGRNEKVAKLFPAVEQKLADLRAKGQNVTREVMLKFVLGEKALQVALKGMPKRQRVNAEQNQNRVRTQSTSGRGNMGNSGKKTGDSPKARLQNITF